MEAFSLSTQLILLGILLVFSAFFSLSETAMIASNRIRLKHWASKGSKGAKWAMELLNQSDKLLGTILLGNNLVNAAAATLVGVITIDLFGKNEWALSFSTLTITFIILVFSEITPKIIGARYAEKMAVVLACVLMPLVKLLYPIVYFINLFPQALLKILKLHGQNESQNALNPEELRALVLESAHNLPLEHRDMLTALFDLQHLKVEDIMTPRQAMEFLDITHPTEELRRQIASTMHSFLPVCEGSLDKLLGVLPIRRLLENLNSQDFSTHSVLEQMLSPYYVPEGTMIVAQLSFFKKNQQRLGFIVNEYGDILGVVTLSAIVEELLGDLNQSISVGAQKWLWSEKGDVLVEGSTSLRDLNKKLNLNFPLTGPKTINGLITEYLEEIPDGEVCLKIGNIPLEILHTEDKSIVTVKISRPQN